MCTSLLNVVLIPIKYKYNHLASFFVIVKELLSPKDVSTADMQMSLYTQEDGGRLNMALLYHVSSCYIKLCPNK